MSEIILYNSPDGFAKVEVFFEDEIFCLTQRRMAELYGVDVRTINEHVGNIFESGELDREATIRKFRIVQIEGGREVERELDHYSLDASIDYDTKPELQAASKITISMEDWANRLDGFLEFNEQEILVGLGRINHEEARLYAKDNFEKYRIAQDPLFSSDFDRFLQLNEGAKANEGEVS